MNNKITLIDKFLFIFSPILSLPFIFYGIFHKSRVSFLLLSILIGLISFGFFPLETDDKKYYIYLFDTFQYMSFNEFLYSFLKEKPDLIFYCILFLVAQLNLSFGFFSFFVTSITSYLILNVFNKQSYYIIDKKKAFCFFIMAFFFLSPTDLFSGMRNYLSIAFIFTSFYFFIIENKRVKSLVFLILSVLTHFSSALFVLVYLFYLFFNSKAVKFLFFVSLVFIFAPKEYILDVISILNFPEIYSDRGASYLVDGSHMDVNLSEGNLNNLIYYFVRSLWFYCALIFSIVNIKNNEKSFIFLLCLMTVINLVSSSADMIVRYGLVGSISFLSVLFYTKNIKYKNIFISFMFLISFLFFILGLISYKEPFINSLFNVDFLVLPTIFFIDTTT